MEWAQKQEVIREIGKLQTMLNRALDSVQVGDPLPDTVFVRLDHASAALFNYKQTLSDA